MEKDNKLVRSLLFDARQGNNSAFEQLFKINADNIYTLALQLTSSQKTAEKITKDVFFETWLNISSIRVDTSFNGWLIGITVFKILEMYRNGQLSDSPKINSEDIIRSIEKLPDSFTKDVVYALLSSLEDDERIAFVLHYLEIYSVSESSDLLGITQDKFQSILKSAVRKIIEKIKYKKRVDDFLGEVGKMDCKLHPSGDIWKQVSDELVHYKVDRQDKTDKEMEAQRMARAEEYEKEKQILREALGEEEERLKNKKKHSSKRIRKSKGLFKYFFLAAFVLLLVVAYLYFSLGVKWSISNVSGTPKINSVSLINTIPLVEGDLVINNSVSEANLYVSDVGSIMIKPETKVRRIENNVLYLLQGNIVLMRTEAERFFTVQTASVIVTDYYLNGDYNLIVDAAGSGSIECENSWAILKKDKNEMIVPSRYKCEFQNNGQIGLPFSIAASDVLIKAITGFKINDQDPILLDKIINLCEKKDAITLWNLLKLVYSDSRIIVLNKLNELIPFPSGVNQNGLIDLDPKMMQFYLNEIESRY